MVKVARVVSVEFNSPAEKRKTLKEYRARLAEFAPGIELLIAVNTSDTEVLAIQVYPDSDTLERAKELNEQFQETIGAAAIRDRIGYEGDVDFWFQEIKYFGPDAVA
ncbi:MAG: hypothetical protein VX394_04430 [Pseudomonadota bacterium]|nr:hypothetical protein [Pseudomonadota bacterium]MEC7571277.1 hypothetical protein [Pseudomonadota bacterium]MEC8117197.1 hypothetical protein [Pseudomonadota bacterium]MEC8584908.1 hypothetical protein [Pseudomonadota bacterium]MEC8676465.1 hypothetical protein [Pseudomonadota bacterium]|tara:strand:- start:55 stop:375 length:321 start_codon:yes stop_codon:yes gene_type:complete